MTMPDSRYLAWEGCYNIRDIGGYPTKDGKQTSRGAVIRADNICHLTAAGRTALIDYGVRTIIDLRFSTELKQLPNPFASSSPLIYFNLPLRDETDAEVSKALKAATSLQELYCKVLDYGQLQIAKVITTIAEAPPGGVLIHCHAGKDRTGLIVALLLALVGVPYPIIAEDYAWSDIYLQSFYKNRLSNASPSQNTRRAVAAGPETMLGLLSYLDTNYKDAQNYLSGGGLAQEQIRQLYRRLVESPTQD